MRKSAVGFVALLVSGTVCAATGPKEDSPAPEILRALSAHSGEPLTHLLEGRNYKDDAGVWFVQADTKARASSIGGLCEGTRIYAAVRRSGPKTWTVTESERATVVAIKKEGSCEMLPAPAFFAVTEAVNLTDVTMLIDAFNQVQPCARKKEECGTRVMATPWALLDTVGNTPGLPMVLSLDLDQNLSNERLKSYDITFSLDDSDRRFRAFLNIIEGRVQEVHVAQIVR